MHIDDIVLSFCSVSPGVQKDIMILPSLTTEVRLLLSNAVVIKVVYVHVPVF